MASDPILLFDRWFRKARIKSGLKLPEAMALSTVSPKGRPETRMVLLKGLDSGFVFYTNFLSAKGKSLQKNPYASLCFYWEPLDRQVRVLGRVVRVSEKEADEYFHSRPRDSQLGAWASRQSDPLPDRRTLLERFRFFKEKFRGKPVPRPTYWGGYRVLPDEIEFWEGKPNRLHDRVLYIRKRGGWKARRLYP